MLVGETGVGKSSLLHRYSEGEFKQDFVGTAGVDMKQKNIEHMSHSVRMHIWDSTGDVKFRPLSNQQYKKAAGIILVYDVTDQATY